MENKEAVSDIPLEFLQDFTTRTDFDTLTVKIRCKNCQTAYEIGIKKLLDSLESYRKDSFLSIKKQRHFRLPILNIDLTITIWNRHKVKQPKVFIS